MRLLLPARHQGVYRRLYNVASFEWGTIVERSLLSGRVRPALGDSGRQASHFDAGSAVSADRLMWHRRFDSRPTLDGGAHGSTPGSPSADCARIVRDNEVQCPASDRRLRLPGADGAAGAG